MDLLRERQDAQIWNAIEANNFKQALKLVDKRLAKKHSDYLEALKIYIRAKSPQFTEKSAVLIHLEELVNRKPPIIDPDVVPLYDEALEEILPDSNDTWARIIGELRWQCVKAMPKNEDLCRDALKACLSKGDLDHARQIANSLEKSFPNIHNYIFWNITTMFMFSLSQSCPEPQKKLWGGLALAQIIKLAGSTRTASDPKKLPIRSIQNPQELLLLHRILQANKKTEQRLEYLEDNQLGPDAVVAKGDWELWRFKLQSIEDFQQWQKLFDSTLGLLKRARTKDKTGQLAESRLGDWIVWDACIRSAFKLQDRQYTGKISEELEAHLDPTSGIDKSWKRNASLAWMKLQFQSSGFSEQPSPEENKTTPRVIILIKYLQEYGEASTAYDDLQPFIEQLNIDERRQILPYIRRDRSVNTAKEIARVVNKFKVEYLLVCSLPENERRQCATQSQYKCSTCAKFCELYCRYCLQNLAEEAMKYYSLALLDDGSVTKNLLTTDRHPADDIILLAAMCLIKLAMINTQESSESLNSIKTSHILQATALLEYSWKRSKPNFQISLMLIRLYSYLGCGSLAMRAYQRLGIKQIQLDTLSYTLFERISSLHPHPFSHFPEGISDTNTPAVHISKQARYYKDASEQITKNIWKSFTYDSFNSIFEMQEVGDRLERSMGAARCALESRRILRLTEPGTALSILPKKYEDLPLTQDQALSDNYDYITYPNFDSTLGPQFEELSKLFPKPSLIRYRSAFLGEHIFEIITPTETTHIQQTLHLQWLKTYTSKVWTPRFCDELTLSENLAAKVYHTLAVILWETCDREQWTEQGFQETVDGHNQNLLDLLDEQSTSIESMQVVVPAFQPTLHALYTTHEVASAVRIFCAYIKRLDKDAHESQKVAIINISKEAEKLAKLVVEKSTTIKKELNEGGWIDRILECVSAKREAKEDAGIAITEVFSKTVGEDFMEEWAGLCVESWRESVIGFGLLKIPKA